jgi:ribosome biogenesis GTPase
VGDWVALASHPDVDDPVVAGVLPRRSAIRRRDPADRTNVQVLATNVDVVFIVHGLDRELNLRRIERTLAVAFDSGATPVVVLTKADLLDDPETSAAQVRAIALDADVCVASAVTGEGIETLASYGKPDRTIALLGASGVGKSSLINAIVGEQVQETGTVRDADAKGRHTTTLREMILLPNGGVVIDTPGLRGMGLWDAEEGIALAFADIEDLAAECRFRDCAHENEPDCAVIAAIDAGELDERRLDSWRRLNDELSRLEAAQKQQAWQAGEGKRRPPRRGQSARRGGERKRRR